MTFKVTSFSAAYIRAMAKKGADAKKLKAANAAFGSQSSRLMALYGPSPEQKTKSDATNKKKS